MTTAAAPVVVAAYFKRVAAKAVSREGLFNRQLRRFEFLWQLVLSEQWCPVDTDVSLQSLDFAVACRDSRYTI